MSLLNKDNKEFILSTNKNFFIDAKEIQKIKALPNKSKL